MAGLTPPGAVARLALGISVGLVGGALAGAASGWVLGLLTGWCLAATTADLLAWWLIMVSGPEEARARAAVSDPGARLVWVLSFVSGTGTILALVPLLSKAQAFAPHGPVIVLCLWAAASGWVLTHTSFALRYAHMFYRDDPEPAWGLDFPGGKAPRDLDFAYFAFTVGVTCAVSDVEVTCPQIRSTVLLHSVVSFVFNTGILALVLNLVLARLT